MDVEDGKTRNAFASPVSNAWLQRIGIAGFLFFLMKGLLWVAAVVWLAY